MKVIGVTGPSGAGKTLFCKKLCQRGAFHIDADEIYHSLLMPPSACLDAIFDAFGKQVANENGGLDRGALSRIVFADPEKLELLNATVLGYVIDKIRAVISSLAASGAELAIVDAPTLIESGFHTECDAVISVLSPIQDRIRRIAERDGISADAARMRVNAQKPDDFYRANSDFVIVNDGDDTRLDSYVTELLEKSYITKGRS